MNIEDTRKQLIDSILAGERQDALHLLDEWAACFHWRNTIHEIIEPVLDEIGRRWEAEHISLAVGYMAGKIAEEALLLAARTDQAIPETKGPVVLGNVEDDFHSLGRKLVAIFLRTAGWKVIDLGNDVLAEDFVEAAVNHGAKIIGVSAMMLTTAENIAKIRVELDRRGLSGSIKLAVGGAVFKLRPELIAEVGGDGTAASAVDAPKLMARLLGLEDGHDLDGPGARRPGRKTATTPALFSCLKPLWRPAQQLPA
jgi:methylmalonyl-CoA mutase cobalamin-binding domain/chain